MVALPTLRVDAAYATPAGDSVYGFNRLLRTPRSTAAGYVKSRNNLLPTRAVRAASTATPLALPTRPPSP